jgi:hypothetical protein
VLATVPLWLAVACSGKAAPPTLNLGGLSMREDAYREAVRRLVRSDDHVCNVWLREGTEPVTAMANKTTAGASSRDLQKAMAVFSQECFALN